jgi:O-antigen ligase
VEDGSFRSFGFLTDQVGFALVYFVILCVYEKKYFGLLLFLSSILVTGTRGAIFFAIIALILTFIFQKDYNFSFKKSSVIIKRGIVIISILIFAWISFGDNISSIILLRLDEKSIEGTSEQRIGAMESGITLFLDNPFFGVGLGKFQKLVYNNSELSNKFDYHLTLTKEENMRGYANAQNEFINILVNGGLFSIIAVILFMYNVLKNIRAKIKIMDNPDHQIVAFIFIIVAVFLIQTSLYIFNTGVISLIILILLGRGSSKSIY